MKLNNNTNTSFYEQKIIEAIEKEKNLALIEQLKEYKHIKKRRFEKLVIEYYQKNPITITEIADIFKVSTFRITKILSNEGFMIKSENEKPKEKYNLEKDLDFSINEPMFIEITSKVSVINNKIYHTFPSLLNFD
jgi:predicted HTH domain antitoxin